MSAREIVRGLYAVTPDLAHTEKLVRDVEAALRGGARLVQYRNKTAVPDLRLEQAGALKTLCAGYGAALIVNDHADVARAVDADGVHIGQEDGAASKARSIVGRDKLIGVSCYGDLETARAAERAGADYVAFGSFFPSSVKPNAVRAPIDVLERARKVLTVPVVAIGGITVDNGEKLVRSGADALAVISAVFAEIDIEAAARRFTTLFEGSR